MMMVFLMPVPPYLATIALSYLLGSVPFGYLLVRLVRGEDVRSSGSGNIGATNVARRSPVLGVLTLLLDAAKGFVAVMLARLSFPGPQQEWMMTVAAVCAVLGHMYPAWLRFRGGKGVATGLGSLALVAPKSVLCAIGIFLVIVAAFRYVSLASVVAALSLPVLAWALREYIDVRQLMILATLSALIFWKHRPNLTRLFSGTEPKIGARHS